VVLFIEMIAIWFLLLYMKFKDWLEFEGVVLSL